MPSLVLAVFVLFGSSGILAERHTVEVAVLEKQHDHQLDQEMSHRKLHLESHQYLLKWLNRPGGGPLRQGYASMLEFVVPVKCRNFGLWLKVTERARQDSSSLAEHCVLVECGSQAVKTKEVPCPEQGYYSGPESIADRFIYFGDFMTIKTDEEPGHYTVYRGVPKRMNRADVVVAGRVLGNDAQGFLVAAEEARIRLSNDGHWDQMGFDCCRYPMKNTLGLTEPVDGSTQKQCKQEVQQKKKPCEEEVQLMSGKSAPWIADKLQKAGSDPASDKYLASKACIAWLDGIKDTPKSSINEKRATKGLGIWKSDQYKCEEHIDEVVRQVAAKCDHISDAYCTDSDVICCSRSKLLPEVSRIY